ncbi:MAG: hypothetical protein K9M75_06770 [Phycisphaerae bacterium]|nr:hypothetical protein [Phycisphaerae bacterium]
MKLWQRLLFICITLVVISGCGKKGSSDNSSSDNIYYYLLIGNISVQNGIASVSGMPFDSPVTVFVNENPVTVTSSQGMYFITSYINRNENAISIKTDADQEIGIGIYYQDSNTTSKEVYKTSLKPSNSEAKFKIDKTPSNFLLLPSMPKVPDNTNQNKQKLIEVIKELHKDISSRNGQKAVNSLFNGRMKAIELFQGKKENSRFNTQVKNYTRSDFRIKPFDFSNIEFVWGDSSVLAYHKDSIGNSFRGLFEYDIPDDADPMPVIKSLTFIFSDGQWIIW